MADLPVPQNFLVKPGQDVEVKWLEVQIQERRSKIVRYKQDIEDLTKGKIIELEARIMIAEREISELESKKRKLQPVEIDATESSSS